MQKWERDEQRERELDESLVALAVYLAESLAVLHEKVNIIMTDLSGLQNAIQTIVTDVQAQGTALTRLLTDFEAAQASGNQAAIDAATAALKTQAGLLETFTASVDQADPAKPPVVTTSTPTS